MNAALEDARRFGEMEKNGKAARALLAARSVEPGEGQGARTDVTSAQFEQKSDKLSIKAFSEASKVARNTVSRYLKVWDALADAGEVPHRDELEPGVDVPLPSKETWTKWYREVYPPKVREDNSLEIDPARTAELGHSARSAKLFRAAYEAAENVVGTAGDQLRRLVDSLADLAEGEDPTKAYNRCFHSITEIAASLRARG